MAGEETTKKNNRVVSNISKRRKIARKRAAGEYEKQRQSILTAAVESFKELGFEATKMDDIARRAQLDRASVYYYFKGKKEIFREIIEDTTVANVERAERIAASDASPSNKLRLLIQDLFEIYERHYPYVYIYLQEDMTRLLQDDSNWGREVRALNRRFDAAILSIIEDGISRGGFKVDGDPKLVVKGVVGMCNWSHRWFEPNRKYRASEIATVFADMIINGLAR